MHKLYLTEQPTPFDWDHVYLLGWWGPGDAPHLTTWAGELPYIHVVVTGPPTLRQWGPPMWKARHNVRLGNTLGVVPIAVEQCQLHFAPSPGEAVALAREMRGVRALGWYIKDGFVREA